MSKVWNLNRLFCSAAIVLGLAITASAQTITAQTVTETDGPYDGKHVVCVRNDAAPGFASGSLASDGVAKTDLYFSPLVLFGRDVTLGEVAGISYFTKKGTTHEVDVRDWFLNIYTKPYAGDASTSFYGVRIGAEPYFSKNINDPANTWNKWSTALGTNQLRFFESTAGADGATFGSYTDPDFATFIAQNSLTSHGGTQGGVPYDVQEVLYFSLQTSSSGAPGFTGQIDGLTIVLSDGSIATVNFECDDSDGDGIDDDLDHCPNSDFRPFVNTGSGNTTIPNGHHVDANGCTIQDLVNDCADSATNHGQYVSCITQLANDLAKKGVISNKQREEMKTGAAKSSIGK